MTNELFTQEEVIKRLKISRKTLYTIRKDKAIKGMKVGGSLRFSEADIKKMLN